jgi:enamine deaminase RidA (YjgF/YER057c/UK114 family)
VTAKASDVVLGRRDSGGRLHRLQAFELVAGAAGPLRGWSLGLPPTGQQPLFEHGRLAGTAWDDGLGRWCQLIGMLPQCVTAPAGVQFRQLFRTLELGLGTAGLHPRDLVRTWFVIDSIHVSYADFNLARREFFAHSCLVAPHFPASTAVGGPNPVQAAIMAGALAVRPHDTRLTVSPVDSPLQGSPIAYQSAFSRAVELVWPGGGALLVSGTASIAPDGATLHPREPEAQMDRALLVTEALLGARGFGWHDVVRGVAYFASPEETPFAERLGQRCQNAVLTTTVATLCRRDLVCELEIEARRSA